MLPETRVLTALKPVAGIFVDVASFWQAVSSLDHLRRK